MLVSTVKLYWRARLAGPLGLTGVDGVGLDWPAIIARKNGIIESWSAGKRRSIEQEGIDVIQDDARFIGPHEIEAGDRRITADRFVIATGSSPARPPLEGLERAITSEELLDTSELPARMVVVGGGVIGMELGFCLARAGSHVTILNRSDRVLPSVDEEIRDQLLAIGRQAGIDFRFGVKVERIAADRTVETRIQDEPHRFPADAVLIAAGRPPNTAGLDLEVAGVTLERGAVKVSEFLQSSAPHVYAAGDVAGGHQHTPVAWYEGPIAAHNALKGNERRVEFGLLPTAIFTIPAVGQVGLTEAEARRSGRRVAVNRSPMTNNPAAGVRAEGEGLVKVVYEEGTEVVLGVHVVGAHAEDLVQIAAAGMRGGLTRSQFASMHYVFPTLGSAIFDTMAGW